MRPQDRVLMASFDDRLFVQAEFTSDRSQLRQAVSELARGVGTRLYDIVALTVERRLEGTKDRQAIVLLTDGVDTHSRLADAAMTRALVDRSHLAVYVVQYDTRRSDYQLPTGIRVNGRSIDSMQLFALPEGAEDNSRLFERAHAYLAGLAKASGGRLYRAETAGSLTAVLQQIAGELGRQYTIGYYPANQARDGTYRALRVQVNRHGAQVRTRAGYTAAPGPR
jgi:VWFA-related protein